MLTFAAKMPEFIEIKYAETASLYSEALKDCEEKDLNYCILHHSLLDIFRQVKDQNKETAKKCCDFILKVMSHHKMGEYTVMNFEIVVSLLIFSLDPEMIDQGRLFVMKKKFSKMADIADDPKEK